MKRICFLFALTGFALIIFASCQKEINSDVTSNNYISPPAINDSNYLDKIFDLYDNGSGIDTQNISVCRYDNLRRLTSISDSIFDSDEINFTYYYNGTDTLPYKSMYTDVSSTNADTEIVYHYFDANQQKIKDSIINISNDGSSVNVQVINYSYSPGKMYGEIATTGILPSSAPVYSRDTATLDANNNIISSLDYILSGSDYILNRTSNFTYDNHSNPFSKLNMFKSFNRFPNGETLFWEVMCFNNIITQTETTLPPNQYTFNPGFTYTYGQNGLPVTNTTGSGIYTDTEAYTYKSL
ncbi:MAG: hypothetical protein ABI402_00925 [Ferruginibacter sp.]